jgi:hypothetical protein
LVAIVTLGLIPAQSEATARRVGPSRTYTTIRAAALAAQAGDSILIDAGTYTGDVASWNANNLTVVGVGGRPYLVANGVTEGDKGIWVVGGLNFTADNIEFSGAVSSSGLNGAGIRFNTSGAVTIRNCYFHDNQDGILGGCDNLLVESSTFDHNGYGDGQSHNMYVWGRSFTLQYCYTHRALQGHDVKTRSEHNYILYNRIMDETDGQASYEIDAPNGGETYIIGNVIEQGPATANSMIIRYAEEGASNAIQELYIVNNTIVNDLGSGTFVSIAGTAATTIKNNIFCGPGTTWTGGTVTASNNYIDTSGSSGAKFVSAVNYDYHLTSASPLTILDAGLGAGASPEGFSLMPTRQYVYDLQSSPRTLLGALDLGAFEYSSGAGGVDTTAPTAVRDLRNR